MNDVALYNAKIIEIKDNLDQLKNINIVVSKTKKIITEIEEDTKKEVEEVYEKYNGSVFLEDSLAVVYRNATAKLEKIN